MQSKNSSKEGSEMDGPNYPPILRHKNSVICFAHVTNQMASIEGDFEKGDSNGGDDALQLIYAAAKAWMGSKPK